MLTNFHSGEGAEQIIGIEGEKPVNGKKKKDGRIKARKKAMEATLFPSTAIPSVFNAKWLN